MFVGFSAIVITTSLNFELKLIFFNVEEVSGED